MNIVTAVDIYEDDEPELLLCYNRKLIFIFVSNNKFVVLYTNINEWLYLGIIHCAALNLVWVPNHLNNIKIYFLHSFCLLDSITLLSIGIENLRKYI